MNKIPDGWVARPATAFDTLVGPFYFRETGGGTECGFAADQRHANRRGVVHGGMLVTAFDVALGIASRDAASLRFNATVQLTTQFVSGMGIDEFAIIRPERIRATRSLVFMRGIMTVEDRVIATAEGVWKILRPAAAPGPDVAET